MSFEEIRYEVEGPVATITLNRPAKLNAYTARMGNELAQAFRQASEDDAVRAVILTGEGRGFCAGADISAGGDSFDPNAGSKSMGGRAGNPDAGPNFVHAMFDSTKPIIAAFNGPAIGVGITLALPTDIKIAASNAKFGFVFARRGLVLEAGSAWFLPQLVGLPQALKWSMTGQMFDAEEALRGGLVSEVVPPEQLMARAREIALEIAQNTAPVSVALVRQMLWRFANAPGPESSMAVDGRFILAQAAGGDVKEGVTAFLEKRPPQFPGRVSSDMPADYPWWGKS